MPEKIASLFFDGVGDKYVEVDPKLSPSSEAYLLPPLEPDKFQTFLVSTKEFGEVPSHLSPRFDEAPRTEVTYDIEVPEQIKSLCQLFQGLGGRALLVGGSVRDAVISQEVPELELTSKDFDLEIYGIAPEDLRRILDITFGEHNVRLEGEAFQVYKVAILGVKGLVDISIPRIDNKISLDSSGRGRGFVIEGDPTMNIVEAASRRDLVFNSLAYDPLTRVTYDPFGAVESIRNRTIEVTDPETFVEDPLRVLRVMQFSSRFGFKVSEEATLLCRAMVEAGLLDKLPKERITEEFVKLFTKGIKPSIGLEFIREIGLVERWYPELHALIGCEQDPDWHPEGDVWSHTMQTVDAASKIADRENLDDKDRLVLCLAALGHDFGKPTTTTCRISDRRLISHGHESAGVSPMEEFFEHFSYAGFSKQIRRQVYPLISHHLSPKFYWQQENPRSDSQKPVDMRKAVRRLKYELEEEGTSVYMLALLAEADQRGRNGEGSFPLEADAVEDLNEWKSWLLDKDASIAETESRPGALVSGEEVKQALNLKQGPEVGAVLRAIVEAQLLGVVATKEDAFAMMPQLYDIMVTHVFSEEREKGYPPRNTWIALARGDTPISQVLGMGSAE